MGLFYFLLFFIQKRKMIIIIINDKKWMIFFLGLKIWLAGYCTNSALNYNFSALYIQIYPSRKWNVKSQLVWLRKTFSKITLAKRRFFLVVCCCDVNVVGGIRLSLRYYMFIKKVIWLAHVSWISLFLCSSMYLHILGLIVKRLNLHL